MIKLIIAYILTFYLAPTIGGIVGLIMISIFFGLTSLVSLSASMIPIPFLLLIRGTISFVVGFASVWFAAIVFSWFDLQPTLLMVIIIGLGFLFNDLKRLSHASEAVILSEKAGTVGDLLGVIIGGFYFL